MGINKKRKSEMMKLGLALLAIGATPQRPTTTGVMTTGSPATNSTPGIGAKKTMEAATTSGSGRIAPGCTTEILARARETPNAAGSTGMTGGRKNSGWTATSSGPGTGAGECDRLHGDGMTTTSMAMA